VAVSVTRGGSEAVQGTLFDGNPEIGYRGPIACGAAGISYRQLDYWARTGLVEPSVRAAHGSGSQRLYSFRDILVLKVVKRLLDTGISLQQIRTAVQHLRDRGTDDLAQVTLMSDGVSVYECTSPDEVVDLLAGGQGVFGIALGRVWQEVAGELAELPAVRAEDGLIADGSDELARHRARKTGLPAVGLGASLGQGGLGYREGGLPARTARMR
jgi:DNA-binding transcriptional MerR regulator